MSGDERLKSWESALDKLELDVAAAMTGDLPAAWVPPTGLGPIPQELEGRARLLLEAQMEATELIGASKASTAKHLQAIASIPEPDGRPRLAFLDVTG